MKSCRFITSVCLTTCRKLARPLKVVVDAGSGVGGPVAPPIFRQLGCQVWEIACVPDASFPFHHPDPTVPENLEMLIEKVRQEKADLGIAYDGDADRIGAVNEKGSILWGDELLVLFSRDVLKRNPGRGDYRRCEMLAASLRRYCRARRPADHVEGRPFPG